jgi:hypothetical protein
MKKVHINIRPRSSELSPLDFSVETLKTLLFSPPFGNEETLHQRIFCACQIIRNRPGTFERGDSPCLEVSVCALFQVETF